MQQGDERMSRIEGNNERLQGELESNTKATKEVAENTKDIVRLAQAIEGLQQLIERIALRSFCEAVKLDHLLFKLTVYQRLFQQDANMQLSTHTNCRLGHWYQAADTQARYASSSYFQQLNDPHRIVHEAAHTALHAAQAKEWSQVLRAVNEMETASLKVSQLLSSLSGG